MWRYKRIVKNVFSFSCYHLETLFDIKFKIIPNQTFVFINMFKVAKLCHFGVVIKNIFEKTREMKCSVRNFLAIKSFNLII